jgi:hypothetical protein
MLMNRLSMGVSGISGHRVRAAVQVHRLRMQRYYGIDIYCNTLFIFFRERKRKEIYGI